MFTYCTVCQLHTKNHADNNPKKEGPGENFLYTFYLQWSDSPFYWRVIGYSATTAVIDVLVNSFTRLWKRTKKKELFLTSAKCSRWLETELPINHSNEDHALTPIRLLTNLNLPEQGLAMHLTPLATQQSNILSTQVGQAVAPNVERSAKRRKPFQSLSERGKQKRLRASEDIYERQYS